MRAAWKAQGRLPEELPWRSWAFPYCAWWGLSCCIILIVVEFYLAISPLQESPSAKNFFANYSSVILIVVLFLGARIYYGGPWMIPLKDIKLDDGRRFYQAEAEVEKGNRGPGAKVKRAVKAIFS